MTFNEAKKTDVFVFDYKNQIVKTTYAEHVLESADECTHSTGVRRKLDVEEILIDIYKNIDGIEINQRQYDKLTEEEQDSCVLLGEGSIFAVITRNSYKNGYSIEQEFDNEDEAQDYWFSSIENSDFQRDDRRSTFCFSFYKEALKDRAERVLVYDLNVSLDTAMSIAKKEQILIKAKRI